MPTTLSAEQTSDVGFNSASSESNYQVNLPTGYKFKVNRAESYGMQQEMLDTHYAERTAWLLTNHDMHYTHVVTGSKKFLVNFEMGEATLSHLRYIMSSDAIYLSFSKIKTPYGHPLLRCRRLLHLVLFSLTRQFSFQ